MIEVKAKNKYSKWRTLTLLGIWTFMALHFLHWKIYGATLAPLEINEVLYTLHMGIVTVGFIFMSLVVLGTVVFGRFFCSWACHILALQDACAWLLRKAGIKPVHMRSRTLVFVGLFAALYLFAWPQVERIAAGRPGPEWKILNDSDGWASFITRDFGRNLPGIWISLATFLVCGFIMIYFLGTRGFCRNACPWGALFAATDRIAPGKIVLKGECTDCGICTAVCDSNIQVHKEVREFGKVVDHNCLKDLDCVSNCPNQALAFGFTMPSLALSLQPKDKRAYSFTLGEDFGMGALFIISLLILRGLYDAIPFLLAMGLSILVSFLFILATRIVRKEYVHLNSLKLKISGRITKPGYFLLCLSVLIFVFLAHSAFIHLNAYKGQQAYEKIRKSEGLDLSNPALRAEINFTIGKFETAMRWGLVKPVSIRRQLASLYVIKNESAKAIDQLESIIWQNNKDADAQLHLAEIFLRMGDTSKAEMHLREGLLPDHWVVQPNDYLTRSKVHFLLGQIAEKRNENNKALEAYEAAWNDNPQSEEIVIAHAISLNKAGKTQQAIAVFEQAEKLFPESPNLHFKLGAVYAKIDKKSEAIRQFDQVTRFQPKNLQAHYFMGVLNLQSGNIAEAEKCFSHALQINPGYPEALQGMEQVKSTKASEKKTVENGR